MSKKKVTKIDQENIIEKPKDPQALLEMINNNPVLKAQRDLFDEPQYVFNSFFFSGEYKYSKNEFHEYMYHILQDLDENKVNRIAIAAPRGHGKSQTVKMWLLKQVLYRRFDCITYVSDTYKKSVDHITTIKQAIEMNKRVKGLFGDQVSETWAANDFTTKDGVTIQCIGSNQSPRGLGKGSKRPQLIIIDDGEDEETCATPEQRTKLKNWFFSALLPAGDADVKVVVIGTIIHQDSLLSNLLQMPGWTTRKFAAIQDNGKPLWPEKFNMKKLIQIKQELFNASKSDSWYTEYMNNPISDENREFKREYFDKCYYYDRDLPDNLNIYMVSDFAISKKQRADYSAIIAIGIANNNDRWVLDVRRGKWDTGEIIDNIFDMYVKWKPIKFSVQKDLIWTTIYPFLKNKMMEDSLYIPLYEITVQRKAKKEERIRSLLPWVQSTKFRIKRDMVDYVEEFLSFPKGKHDDMIDASADINEIAQVPDITKEDEEERILEMVLKKNRKRGTIYDDHLGEMSYGN